MDRCTVLFNSCDSYKDTWDLTFTSYKVQWPTLKYPIVLNTQKEDYSFAGLPIKVHHSDVSVKNDKWGKRLINTLDDIESKYVLMLLDDFVLLDPVIDDNVLESAMDWLDDDSISVFYLHSHPFVDTTPQNKYDGFGLMPQKCEYKLTTAVGIWRRQDLKKYVRWFESPWEWEVNGSKRASRYKKKFYAILPERKELELLSIPFGGSVCRGKWKLDTVDLAEKYNVKIDFANRGFADPEDLFGEKQMYVLRKHFPRDIFQKIFWRTVKERITMVVHFIGSII